MAPGPDGELKVERKRKLILTSFAYFGGNVVTFWATFGLKADICCGESLNFGGLSLCSSAKGVNPPYLQLFYMAREAIKWRMHGSQRWLLGQWIDFSACLCACPFVCKQVFGGCVFVCLWMCALPLWPLSCFGVRSLRHLIMERVVAGNHNRNKPLRGGIFIGAKKKKKSCFQENKRSGRGLVLIGSGVWGKWGEKRIISSWEMVKFYREFLGEVPTIRDAENPVPVIESSSTEMRCLSSLTESRYGTDTTGIWTLHLKWFYLLTLRDSLYKVHTKPSWTILHFSGDFRHSKSLMLFEPLYCSFSFFFFWC